MKSGINEPNSHARHAYIPVDPAVKSISAPGIACKISKNAPNKLTRIKTMTDAILDSQVYTSHRIELKGESFRKKKILNLAQKGSLKTTSTIRI